MRNTGELKQQVCVTRSYSVNLNLFSSFPESQALRREYFGFKMAE